ncbi:MAG TPA: HAD family phosphatase [Cellvibrionaceae bacterium]
MLVIWDCDGVLVESERLAAEAFSRLLAQFNVLLSTEQCEGWFVGKTLTQCIHALHQKYPGCLPDSFRHQLDQISDAIFEQHLKPVRDVEQVLRALHERGIPLAVASNGGWEKTRANLQRTSLLNYFADNVFSAEHVAQPKPAPDVYLAAAEAQGVPPQFCCVIEDSHVGALAGLSAGMRVLFFRPAWRTHYEPAPVGVQVFDDMQQLLGIIFRNNY